MRVIEVDLEQLIPHIVWVGKNHLRGVRKYWDQGCFERGERITVHDLDGRYFITDGCYTTYIALFDKRIKRGKVTLWEEKDCKEGHEIWKKNIAYHKKLRDEVFSAGVHSMLDLKDRLKTYP